MGMRKVLIVLLAIFLSGCVNMSEVMRSWEGQHFGNLIASWGPPQGVMDDGSGGKIFIYTQSRQWTTPGRAVTNVSSYGNTYGNINMYNNYGNFNSFGTGYATATTTYTPPQVNGYQAWRMFWINSNGYIYRWQWKGL